MRTISRKTQTKRHRQGLTIAWIASSILIVVILTALLAPYIGLTDPLHQSLTGRLKGPMTEGADSRLYLFGTDSLGRDVLSRSLFAGRVSLLVGFIVATVSALVGTALGVMGAWKGGTIRAVVLRLIEVQLAFPFLVIAIAIIAVLSPSILTIIIILSAWIWVPFARVSYDGSLRLRNMEFISSARLAGYGSVYIVIRHVLPNIMGELIVIWTFSVAQAIVAESALSFLGLGIQPPTPSWGIMISEGKEVLNIAWWVMTVPAIILSCVVLAINLLGDFLRDRFDPVLASK